MFKFLKSLKEALTRNKTRLAPLPCPRCGDSAPGYCEFCNGQGIILVDLKDFNQDGSIG